MSHARHVLIRVVLFAGAALLATSCSLGCTEVGCSSGLKLELSSAGATPEAFTATLTWREEGSTRSQTLTCPQEAGDGDCANRVLFLPSDTFPESAHLVVETPSAGRFEGDVSLDWRNRDRPNGSFCPPECASATTQVSLQ